MADTMATDSGPVRALSMQEAVALAEAGDAQAQYALSSTLHARGLHEHSLHWLRLAAARLPEAQLTLATLLMDGRHCPRDLPAARALLGPLAAHSAAACLLLAELDGYAALGGTDRASALRHLLAAAQRADGSAWRQLGLLAASHRRWELAPALLAAAARCGDAIAQHVLQAPHGAWDPAAPMPLPDPALLVQALPDLAADLPLPPAQELHATPLVRRFAGVIPRPVAEALVRMAEPLVQRSQVVDATSGQSRVDSTRTSSHAVLGARHHDHVLEAIAACMGRVSGLPAANGEYPQVMRYRTGEEFVPHVDYFNESGAGSRQSLADGGQRVQTVLLYLSDDYSGGATVFPELGLEVRGRPGELLHFHNVDAAGIGHRDSLHAGLPVTGGEKWLLSQWLRAGAYRPRVAW